MKSIIIYFSQTGNTEKVAYAIQAGVKKETGHCDIVKINDANPRHLYEYDLIGLGCPVFHFFEPGNVKAFINNIRFVGGKHIFAFSTHGTIPEFFFPSIVPLLKRRGLIVIGMHDWYGGCNLPMMPKPYPTDGHPDQIDLKEAKDFGREMVQRSRRISAGEIDLIPPNPSKPPPLPEALLLNGVPNSVGSFLRFHKEKCTYPECRICMDNCPIYGIDLTVNPPVIAKPCLSCMFCVRTCPTGAIDGSGVVRAVKTDTIDLMSSWIIPHLKKAQAEGRFRPLVPLDRIGQNIRNEL